MLYLLIPIVLSAFWIVCSRISSAWRNAKQAKEWGCLPTPAAPSKLPLGIDHVMRLSQADKKHKVPQENVRVYREANRATFRQNLFGSDIIVTHDPRNIQAVLAKQFKDFEIGPIRRNNFFPMLGIGIFTAEGKVWEHSRAALRPQFARDQVADLELEEVHLQNLLKHLTVDSSGWTSPSDLGPMFFRLTIDSATELLFGESINSQIAALGDASLVDASKPDFSKLAYFFDHGTACLGTRARLSSLFWLYNPRSFKDDCREIQEFANYCIDRSADKKAQGVEAERYIFLDELLKITTDKVEIRSQLLNILLAGRDTTAGLLGWTFWTLSRHPKLFQKLREAIIDDFGTYSDPTEITFASLKSCSYLQYVMNEILRLYPSVPINARQAVKETTIPYGGGPTGSAPVYVKKGQEVMYSVYVMHRRRDIWGEDADEFNPDRWIGRKYGWEFLPFNGGPRVCLGQQFALTEAGYIITRLMQRFDHIENHDLTNEELHQYSVTTAPKNVFVKLRESKG